MSLIKLPGSSTIPGRRKMCLYFELLGHLPAGILSGKCDKRTLRVILKNLAARHPGMIFEWCFCTNRLLSFRILPRLTKIGSLRSFYHIFLTEFLPGGSPAIQNGGRFFFLPGIVELPGSFISDTYRSQMSSQISLKNI